MDGEQRREEILKQLQKEIRPISGTYLSKYFNVSRQVIVQDVALLRARGYDILATARGDIFNEDTASMLQRVVWVKHTHDEAEDELNTIIDNGGRLRNVIIMHPIYGELVADLMIKTRREVKQFVEKLKETKASTLLSLTDGMHMHTIEASTEEELDIIEEELSAKGYLVTHS